MPPSLGGSSRGRSTVNPRSSSSRTLRAEQQRVLEHPAAQRHHVEPALLALAGRPGRRPASATAAWNRAAIDARRPRPRRTSSTTARTTGRRRPRAGSRPPRTRRARPVRRRTGPATPARSPPRPRSRRCAGRRPARTPRRRAGPCWRWARSRGRCRAGGRGRTAPAPGRRPRRGGRRSQATPARAEVGQRHPVGPQHAGVAAGERDVAEVGRPAERLVAGDQDLAAPDRAVGAVAGAVEGDPDHLVVRCRGRARPSPTRRARGGAARRGPRGRRRARGPRPTSGSPGARRRPPAPGRTPVSSSRCRSEAVSASWVARSSRSPMCWLSQA